MRKKDTKNKSFYHFKVEVTKDNKDVEITHYKTAREIIEFLQISNGTIYNIIKRSAEKKHKKYNNITISKVKLPVYELIEKNYNSVISSSLEIDP